MITAGLDIGSSAVKIALVRGPENGPERVRSLDELIVHRVVRLCRRDPKELAEQEYSSLLAEMKLRPGEVSYVATTGEGELISFRTGHFYSMTAHARGALFLEPEARAALDVGALHARAIVMDGRSRVSGYRMTSQCASGSGQFLENISRYLGVTLHEVGELSQEADKPEKCSSICAVLAETDVINMVSRGMKIPNILRGIHESMAGRFVRLLTAAGACGIVLVSGGLAADTGLLAALRDEILRQDVSLELRTHPHSALAGAIGAALWGAFRFRTLQRRGLPLHSGRSV